MKLDNSNVPITQQFLAEAAADIQKVNRNHQKNTEKNPFYALFVKK